MGGSASSVDGEDLQDRNPTGLDEPGRELRHLSRFDALELLRLFRVERVPQVDRLLEVQRELWRCP
jgi:hypothetical protein